MLPNSLKLIGLPIQGDFYRCIFEQAFHALIIESFVRRFKGGGFPEAGSLWSLAAAGGNPSCSVSEAGGGAVSKRPAARF